MKFFNAGDFRDDVNSIHQSDLEEFAKKANTKLEREGKTVYSYRPDLTWFTNQTSGQCKYCGSNEIDCCRFYKIDPIDTHKAILINIETIEQCKHESSDVNRLEQHLIHGLVNGPKTHDKWDAGYLCKCGKMVKPKSFEEV